VVDGNSGTPSGSSQAQYWDRFTSVRAGDERLLRKVERSRLFEQEAERYDRWRPSYPQVGRAVA
jgi:hypothetical protein